MSWVMSIALSLAVAPVGGLVYEDANGNGRHDATEPGIGGVVVSNQHTVALTSGDGRFALDGAGTGVIFASVPSGYRATAGFWRRVDGGPVEIGLARIPPTREFVFVHASDTHVQSSNATRVDRVRALADSVSAALVLVSGDLVRDALRVPEPEARGYFELYRDLVAKFPMPVWSTMGNHENFGIERHRSLVSPGNPLYGREMYRHYLGPDYYSFNFGGIHFVALNTVDIDDLWYYGHVDSVQVAWLERDLAALAPETPVVTFNHIPFFSTADGMRGYDDGPPAPMLIRIGGKDQFRHVVSNAREVLTKLWHHPYPLALGGHVHLRELIRYGFAGQTTRFEQAAAVVGGWQDRGISARSGIAVYRVRDGAIGESTFVPLDP